MIKKICIISLFLIVLYSDASFAQEEDFPDYTGYVNDFAGILAPDIKAIMSSIAQQVETRTTAQIAVVTLPTVKPLTIEQYAVELFEKWSIGQKDKDNGVLILMAVNDKKVRIETGYGLEGALPDAICNRIIYQIMIPEFKKEDFGRGLLRGTIAVAELIAKEYNISLDLDRTAARFTDTAATPSKGEALFGLLLYLLLFILIFGPRFGLLFWLLTPTGRRRRDGYYWYGGGFGGTGGGFGGGFGGFGGGYSGGGGSSGSW